MFDSSSCESCQSVDCLMRCQWIDFDGVDAAKAEMEKMIKGEESHVLSDCVTCFACDEYCPNDSHPFDLFVDLQEKFGSHELNPKILEMSIKQFKPHDEVRLKEIDASKPILNKCAFVKSHAKHMEGKLFEDLEYVAGLDFFCNLLYHHIERDSIIRERLPIILGNIKKQGIKEMVCFHDECYGLYASYCPRNNIEVPFKPIHLFEYLHDYLKDHESEITKLNKKIAFQRNCSNRFIPEVDKWIDGICEMIGVERVARKYDRENALCCAAPFPMLNKKKLVRNAQNDNVQDALDHEAEMMIYNCPMCMDTLGSKASRKGLKNYLLSDLVRISLGEELDY